MIRLILIALLLVVVGGIAAVTFLGTSPNTHRIEVVIPDDRFPR